MMEFISRGMLDAFYLTRSEGKTVRTCCEASGIPYALGKALAAEASQRKAISYEQMKVLVKYLASGCTIRVAAQAAGIPYQPATFVAAEWNRERKEER